jgi:hypothetical protein
MIVLDEQLLGYGLQAAIARWYRGQVTDITSLRPQTVIPDDAIPELLLLTRQPSFVTINVADFWRRLAAHPGFAIVCFALPNSRAAEISPLLRRLFSTAPFRTRKRRLGKIARVSQRQVQYYSTDSSKVRRFDWP